MARHKRYSKVIHFKNKEDYRRWLAYNWIHNRDVMGKAPNKEVFIAGKHHKVNHKKR